MASFTDEITQFNPYIKDFATDAFVTAGMIKQQKYDTNVQKVNSFIESLYGFPIARDVDKQYLHSKINNFTDGINKFLSSADFSNDSIVNQVGAYAGQIASDKYVQNAIQNTARMQKDLSALETAKKEGKGYSPANEFHLMKSVNAYMTGDFETPYQSEGYIPAIDANDEIQKLWKDKHPNSSLQKRVGLDGSTGWVMVTEQGEKAITQQQVMAEIESTIDPRVRKQLSIDAAYKLNGVDPNSIVDSFYKDNKQYLDDVISSTSAALLTADPETKKLLQEQLTKAQTEKNNLKSTIEQTKELARQNPDAVKDQLYYQQWLRGTGSRIAYSETKYENLIYKDYYDIMNAWYDNLIKAQGKGKEGEQPPQLPLVERPISEDQAAGVSLSQMRTEILDQKTALDSEWNEVASKILADEFDAAGLSKEAQDLRSANREVYYDKSGKFISPSTYNSLPSDQKAQYKKGNFAKNLVQEGGVDRSIFTIRNKSVYDGLKRELEKQYHEGNPNLPIEVKEYFDKNITQQKILDAKAKAISEIDKELETFKKSQPEYLELESARKNFRVQDTFKDKPITVTGDELLRYFEAKGSSVRPDLESISRNTGIPLEKLQYIRQQETWVTAPSSQAVEIQRFIPRRDKQFQPVLNRIKENEEALTRRIQGTFNERVVVLEKGKAEDSRNIGQIVTYISGMNKESGQDAFKGIEWDDVQTMVTGKDRENTTFAYGQIGATGEPFIEVTNPSYNKGKAIRIPIDQITAQTMGLYQNDPLNAAKQIISLKGGTTGNTIAEALPVQNGGKYKASYNIDRLQSGNYKLKLYIAAPGLNNGVVEFVDNSEAYSEARLGQILQSINDGAIENFIKHRQDVEAGKVQLNPQIKPFSTATPISAQNFMQGMPGAAMPTFPGIMTNQ